MPKIPAVDAHADVFSGARGLEYKFSLHLQDLYPYFSHLVIPRVTIRYLNPWPHKDTFFRLSMP